MQFMYHLSLVIEVQEIKQRNNMLLCYLTDMTYVLSIFLHRLTTILNRVAFGKPLPLIVVNGC